MDPIALTPVYISAPVIFDMAVCSKVEKKRKCILESHFVVDEHGIDWYTLQW